MVKTLFWLLLALTVLTTSARLYGQATDSLLNRIMSQVTQSAESGSPDLFLHLDKSIYVHNENILFTAYLLNNALDLKEQQILYVSLIDPATHKLVNSERFAINGAFANGSLFLADSLQSGEYLLIAYTNTYLQHPEQGLFKQSVSLRSVQPSLFTIISLPVVQKPGADSMQLAYKITTSYGGIASGGDFAYSISGKGKSLISGHKRINAFGEVTLTIPQTKTPERTNISITVNRNKNKQNFLLPVIPEPDKISAGFYPEGGNLVNNHPVRVALELRTQAGKAISAKGWLLQDGIRICPFTTNQYGQGCFQLIPITGKKYKLELDPSDKQQIANQQFPDILDSGYTMTVDHGVITDTLSLQIATTSPNSECVVMVHNYKDVFYCYRIRLLKDKGRLNIDTKDFPEGIATVTLFNAQGIPQAERAIYLPPPSMHVQIEPDSLSYHKRSHIQLHVKVTDDSGKGIPAVFSLGAVFAKRLDSLRFQDIVRFNYIDKFLPRNQLSTPPDLLGDTSLVETTLLTRFWTRYRWNDMIAQKKTVSRPESLNPVTGYVLRNGKKVRQPVGLMVVSRSIGILATDSSGYFELSPDRLADSADSPILVSVMGTKKQPQQEFSIHLKEASDTANQQLSTIDYAFQAVEKDVFTAEEKEAMRSMLQEVVVTANNEDQFASETFVDSSCNAFVCACGHWMCNGCKPITKPIVGGRYFIKSSNRSVVYMGCPGDMLSPFVTKIKPTHLTKDFYVTDYEKYPPPQPEVFTTLYWSNLVATDKQGEAILYFTANDLPGRFTCVLQGRTAPGEISAKKSFNVVN